MPEIILGLILLAAAVLVAFGVFVGRLLFGGPRSEPQAPPPSTLSDIAATSRTIRRLADAGAIDEALRARLFHLLRESYTQGATQNEAPPTPPVRPAPPAAAEFPAASLPSTDAEEILVISDEEKAPTAASAAPARSVPPVVPHPLDAPEPVAAPGPSRPQQRRRALADVLQAFMQDKNIRWGELVSGVLIVGCSIALVISLRQEIERIRDHFIYLPALLFMLATAAIHAAGNYTLRQWNLQATSRGVLIIATLLIPINFLAAIIVTGPEARQLPPFHPLFLSAVAVGLLAFGTMAYFASQALMREGPWRLWVGVMGTSVGQLVINRLSDRPASALAASLLVSLPLAAYLVATIGQLRAATRRGRIGKTLASETLLLLGITSFSLAAAIGLLLSSLVAAIGLLLSRSDSIRLALAWLSPALTLPAVVILATGIALHRGVLSRRLSTLKTVGTSLALTGGVMMLAAVLLAWPQPSLLIAVGLFSFASLSLLAAAGRLPALHVPALACGALAGLVGFHMLQGSFAVNDADLSRRMHELFFMGRSSVVLTALAVVVGVSAGLLLRQGRRASALSYLVACGGIAVVSVAIAIAVGFFHGEAREPNLASPVLMFYAVTLLVASYLRPTAALTWAGSTLLLVGFVHSCGWNSAVHSWLAAVSLAPSRPVLVATLTHGLVAAGAAFVLARREAITALDASSPRRQQLVTPLTLSALLTSAWALPSSLLVRDQAFGEHAWYMAALALIWLAATFVQRLPLNFSIFQTVATVAVVFTTASVCRWHGWLNDWLFAPTHLQFQFGALALWCLAWSVGRRLARRRWPDIVGLMRYRGHAIDDYVLGATISGMFLMSYFSCEPIEMFYFGAAETFGLSQPLLWQSVFSLGSWAALLLLLAALIGSLIERFSLTAVPLFVLLAASAALLTAGRLYETQAVEAGIRWSFAILGVLLTAAIYGGPRIEKLLRQIPWLEWDELPRGLDPLARSWTLAVTAIPILGYTTLSLVQAASGIAAEEPAPESFFSKIGPELSYGFPLLLLTGVLVAHAVRERRTGLMLAGSAVFQYLVNLAYFLPILQTPGARFDWSVAIGCLQWNSLGLAAYALAWLSARQWIEQPKDNAAQGAFDRCLVVQIVATLTAIAATTGLATFVIISTPEDLTRFAGLGSWLSYLVCLLGFGAAAWLTRTRLEQFGISLFLGFLFATGGVVAISLEGNPGSWRAFHVLMIVWLSVALAATVLSWAAPAWRKNKQLVTTAVQWAAAFIGLSVLLALRGVPFDPQTPWWSFATTLASAFLAGALGFRTRSQAFAYASTLLAAVAATIVWWGAWPNDDLQGVIELVQLNLIALVVMSLVWLFAEARCQARWGHSFDRFTQVAPVHRATAVTACVVAMLLVGLGFGLTGLIGVVRSRMDVANLTGWILLPLLGGLLVGSLWDRFASRALPLLYTWSVMAVLMALDEADQWFEWDRQTVFVAAGLSIAAFVALTGHLWKYGATLAVLGQRLGIPDPVSRLKRTAAWLPVVTLLFTAVIVFVELAVVLAFGERWMRVGAAFAPLLLAYGVACQAQQQRRATTQYASLLLVGVAALYAVWADIKPDWRETIILERAVRLLTVLAVGAFLYAVPISRWTRQRGGDWFPVVRRMAVHCGAAAIAALVGVLVLELAFFEPGVGVPFGHPYQVVTVSIVLAGLIVAFIALALSPERDPLSLTEEGRMGYTYAAQMVGALLFAHIYLSHPQLFGRLTPYWPYIVMGIAFAGVGVGEIFQRAGRRVLAEPLQRTGGFLPLLPALGWWLNRSLEIDAAGHYSLLLFMAGLLYVALSMLRGSYISGVAAALAGNAALWALLADYEPLSLLKHPQFWLIPPAVSTLAAAQLNRRSLGDSQLTAIRYLCLLVIYVSSTADIFMEGVGQSLWEPMVLATLSVIGVFVGIGLQIRAFLYLGSTFVFMSVVSMVWHAYANIRHVGIWWGFGILLGLLILTIFGLFEKKRPELTRLVENMRRWEN